MGFELPNCCHIYPDTIAFCLTLISKYKIREMAEIREMTEIRESAAIFHPCDRLDSSLVIRPPPQ